MLLVDARTHPGFTQIDLLGMESASVTVACFGTGSQRIGRIAQCLDAVRQLDHGCFQLLDRHGIEPCLEHRGLERILVFPTDRFCGVEGEQFYV